jgi:phage-related protein
MEPKKPPKGAIIAWEGNSKDIISAVPDGVKENLGFQFRQLQQGEQPTDYRAVPQIGQGVFKLRDQDDRAWYRVVYLSRVGDVIHVLHCFEKESKEIPKNDADTARKRFQIVKARMLLISA